MNDKRNIILYTTPDREAKIEVTLQDETVWLTLDQMAELFQRNKSTISRHIKNIFETGELNKELVVAKNATTTRHGTIKGKTQMPNPISSRSAQPTNLLQWRLLHREL